MGPLVDQNLLSLITFLPFATGLVLLGSGALAALTGWRSLPDLVWRAAGLGSTWGSFLLSLVLFARFDPTRTGFQFIEHVPWITSYGIHYFVGIDGISLLLVVLTTFLMPLVLLASSNDLSRSIKSYVFFMLFLQTGMLGAF